MGPRGFPWDTFAVGEGAEGALPPEEEVERIPVEAWLGPDSDILCVPSPLVPRWGHRMPPPHLSFIVENCQTRIIFSTPFYPFFCVLCSILFPPQFDDYEMLPKQIDMCIHIDA